MRYILLAVFLLAAPIGAASAQPIGPHRDARTRSPEELKKDAADLKEALKNQPNNVELYIRLGFTYARLKEADEALQAFENVVRLDHKKTIAYYMLGLIYEKQGLKDKAIAAWKACLDNASEPRMRETARKHLHHLAIQ